MAGSKFAYVKSFELPDPLLPNAFLVARIDGHAFHRFSDKHGFSKPNDERALRLMDHAARNIMEEYRDIVLAFGESDEYSFLFRKSCVLYNRRASKIITTITSLFTASYVMVWPQYFPDTPLKYPPSFDGRVITYPSEKEVKDYFSWRQTDTHINNLYNTVFWALVQQGEQTTAQAHEYLRGTVSNTKNEILFNRFGINYNALPARFRKGSVLVRVKVPQEPLEAIAAASDSNTLVANPLDQEDLADPHPPSALQSTTGPIQNQKKKKPIYEISILHCDIIKNDFWCQHSDILI